jgi:Transcriptional regulators
MAAKDPGEINISMNKNTMRSDIEHYIQRLISTGVYKPGDRIVETRLAKELNVSQAPVREAILELSVMGLLEERPYSGTFVTKLSAEDIIDIYDTRAFIEEYAATRAAERITDEQFEKLSKLMRQMDRCDDCEDFVELDKEFHETIMDAAASPALKRVWMSLRMSEWTYTSTLVTERSLSELIDAHRMIYDCIRRHADHTAGAYMFIHIRSFSEELIKHLIPKEGENKDGE